MSTSSYDEFRQHMLGEGHDEVLVREWTADFANAPHTHPFDSDVRVVRGEFWLSMDGTTRHLQVGDHFQVPRGVSHSEKYGAQGATFWAARKN